MQQQATGKGAESNFKEHLLEGVEEEKEEQRLVFFSRPFLPSLVTKLMQAVHD